MTLDTYRDKRDFARTPEPRGKKKAARRGPLQFVVQQHAARRMHYDFRLELAGVLKSWAVPKGPPVDPRARRLAVMTEDHPLEYASFEGVIPAGEYGAGPVIVWDRGHWLPEGDPEKGLERGRLEFQLLGEKLRGRFLLVRTSGEERQWLLIKRRDEHARAGELVDEQPASVVSRRSIEEVRAQPERIWTGPEELAPPPGDPRAVPGAKRAAMPKVVEPQLATLVDAAPEGDEWLHEVKLDGYRITARIDRGRVRLASRRNNDWSGQFPRLVEAARALPCEQAIVDGEVVVLDAAGRSSFQELQNALREGDPAIHYVAFDLLYLDGYDLRDAPLRARKEALRLLLGGANGAAGVIRYSDHVLGRGAAFHRQACRAGLEGIVSKRAESRHRSQRTRDWLKVKCLRRQEFVIVGYTDPQRSRTGLGALLVAVHGEDGRLTYSGKVGTGFSQATLQDLRARLEALETKTPPVSDAPRAQRRGVHWVAPRLVAEVKFAEWTNDGILRQPSFVGLREDKPSADVVRERPEPAPDKREVAGVRLTNPQRIFFPEVGVTKVELAEYYERVCEWMLPHVVERPVTMVRCPEGRDRTCFYQKHATASMPPELPRVKVKEGGKWRLYVWIDGLSALVRLVQLGVLEIHVPGMRVDKLDHPDVLVFDLDPAPDVDWPRVVTAARALATLLDELGLASFVRTTGGKGLHVVVPIIRRTHWDDAKAFTREVALALARQFPDEYVATMSKKERSGKIFIDYLRNSAGATAITSYSARARPGAPVAVPISWDELDDERPHWTIRTLPARLDSLAADPWADFHSSRRAITAPARRRLAKL